jgi:hypothetical protein
VLLYAGVACGSLWHVEASSGKAARAIIEFSVVSVEAFMADHAASALLYCY